MYLNKANLQLNPNNQIVLTYGNYREVSEFYKSRECGNHYDAVGKAKLDRVLDNLEAQRQTKYDWRGCPIVKAKKRPAPPLAIIKKSQDIKKEPKPNRPKSFTQAAGQKLRECGASIDHICGKPENCYTVTLTLPANTEEAFKALADDTGFAINYLFQPVRDQYQGSCYWFFVWEYQKRGALHAHIAVYHPDLETTKAIANGLADRWYVVLKLIQERSGIDMFVKRDRKSYTPKEKYHRYVQPVRRSMGAYFSKYAGKQESKNNWYCQKYHVSRFWGCSQTLKNLIKSLSFDYSFKSNDSAMVEAIVCDVLAKICRDDVSIKSSYDFDIKKTYNSGYELSLATGTRVTAYCDPKSYQVLLNLFGTMGGVF